MNFMRMRLTFKMPKKYDLFIHISVIALIVIGTLMITSTSVGETYNNDTVVIKTFIKQLGFVILSYLAMVFMANNFTMSRAKWWSQTIGVLLLGMLLACLMFDPSGGSRAWLRLSLPMIGEVTLQPSEFFKTFMIVLMAVTVETTRRKENYSCWTIIKVPVIFMLLGVFFIGLQNDAGSIMVLTVICGVCFLIPTHKSLRKLQHILMVLILIGGIASLFLLTPAGLKVVSKLPCLQEHQLSRFIIADNPFSDPFVDGYQLINSLYAFATGKWTGLGLGQSIQKMLYLPEAKTDYILAITVEELGIGGFLYILFFYVIIMYRLFYYAFKAKSEGYKILLVGTAVYMFVHFLFNVGGVTGLLPLTGVPLLFISSGSSSLLSICCAVGISQAVIAKMRNGN